jgi:hypothetical protein
MSSFGGLMKVQSYWNKIQQKRDWVLIVKTIGQELQEPDWSKSVKKVDKYMEDICKKYNLNHLEFFGRG